MKPINFKKKITKVFLKEVFNINLKKKLLTAGSRQKNLKNNKLFQKLLKKLSK